MVRMEELEPSIFRLKVGSLTNLATFSQEREEVAHLPPIKRTRQGTPILESGRNRNLLAQILIPIFPHLLTMQPINAPPACVQAGRELNPNSFWLGCTPLPEGIDRSVFLSQLSCRQHIRHLVAMVGFEPTMFLMWRILSALCLANCITSPSGILFSFLTLGTYLVYHKFSQLSSIFFKKLSNSSSSRKKKSCI